MGFMKVISMKNFVRLFILIAFSCFLSMNSIAECKDVLIDKKNMYKTGSVSEYSENYNNKDLKDEFNVHLSFDFRSPLYQKSLLEKEKVNFYIEVLEYSLSGIIPLHKAVVRNYHTKEIAEFWYVYYYNSFIATISSFKPMDEKIVELVLKCEKER